MGREIPGRLPGGGSISAFKEESNFQVFETLQNKGHSNRWNLGYVCVLDEGVLVYLIAGGGAGTSLTCNEVVRSSVSGFYPCGTGGTWGVSAASVEAISTPSLQPPAPSGGGLRQVAGTATVYMEG